MINKLKVICGKFLYNKYPNTYRNIGDYVAKTGMKSNAKWGGDLELFAAGLLFRTDIWIFSKDTGNTWNVFSGKGASIDQVMNTPPANTTGSIFIVHTGNHYEPVLEISDKEIETKF